MSVSCVQLNNSKWIYDSVNVMPHETVCNVIVKIAAGVLAVLAMIPALIIDLVASAYNYLCGEKVIENKEAEPEVEFDVLKKCKGFDLKDPSYSAFRLSIKYGFNVLEPKDREEYAELIKNFEGQIHDKKNDKTLNWMLNCYWAFCLVNITEFDSQFQSLSTNSKEKIIKKMIRPNAQVLLTKDEKQRLSTFKTNIQNALYQPWVATAIVEQIAAIKKLDCVTNNA